MEASLKKKIIWLAIFSIAMGFMETVIVVYLRKLYYPDGFQFPLIVMDMGLLRAEFLREAATVIMLLAVGILTGKTASQKFAFFIFCFAIWDLFYYVFLKILLDWPESLFTWDILFLIPVPWIAPVIAPCIVSLTMIVLACSVIYFTEKGWNTKIKFKEWLLLIIGSVVVILSFSIDTLELIPIQANTVNNTMVPSRYNWWLFGVGEAIIVSGIIMYLKRIKNGKPVLN